MSLILFQLLRDDMQGLRDDMQGLRVGLEDKIEILRADLTVQVKTLSTDLTVLRTDFTELRTDLTARMDILTAVQHERHNTIQLAHQYSGRIRISPPSQDGNDMACGTLISAFGKAWFLTSKHVLLDDQNKMRTIKDIEVQGLPLSFDNDPLVHEKFDLALVNIQNRHRGVDVSNTSVGIFQRVLGVAFREKGTVIAVSGEIREMKSKFGGASADIQGTHGFSGLGYFTNETLFAVHQGQGTFSHFKAVSVLDTRIKEECIRDSRSMSNSTEIQECIDAYTEFMLVHTRNPLTDVVSAHHIFDTGRMHLASTMLSTP